MRLEFVKFVMRKKFPPFLRVESIFSGEKKSFDVIDRLRSLYKKNFFFLVGGKKREIKV